LWPEFGANRKPLADGSIKLIKMLIAPIIFCTVVIGIAHVGNLKAVGRIGVKALIYFEVVTTKPAVANPPHRQVPAQHHSGLDSFGLR